MGFVIKGQRKKRPHLAPRSIASPHTPTAHGSRLIEIIITYMPRDGGSVRHELVRVAGGVKRGGGGKGRCLDQGAPAVALGSGGGGLCVCVWVCIK